MEAAIGGDLEQTEEAIETAKLEGVPERQIALLRGMKEFYGGNPQGAIPLLTYAVDLAPESAAARGMLAIAHAYVGDSLRHDETMSQLEKLTPRRYEDFLFKGYAEHWNDPAKGLQTMRKAVEDYRSRSPLARAMMAEARIWDADDCVDPSEAVAKADLAREEALLAKAYLRDNPYAVNQSRGVHSLAVNIYKFAADERKRKEALKVVSEDGEVLNRWKSMPHGALGLWRYYELTSQTDKAFEVLEYAGKKWKDPQIAYIYALELYRRGQADPTKLEEALDVLKKRVRSNFQGDFLRVCILAELSGAEIAAEAAEQMCKDFPSGIPALHALNALLVLGKKEEAVMRSRALASQPLPRTSASVTYGEQYARSLEFRSDPTREDAFLTISSKRKHERCASLALLGLMHLAENRTEAKNRFKEAVATRAGDDIYVEMSEAFLARMENNKNWPPWLN